MEFKMNKVPLLAVVAFVLGTSAAFAANNELLKPDFATTEKCSYLEQNYPAKAAMSYSSAKQLTGAQNAESYCRTDKHKTAMSDRHTSASHAIGAKG